MKRFIQSRCTYIAFSHWCKHLHIPEGIHSGKLWQTLCYKLNNRLRYFCGIWLIDKEKVGAFFIHHRICSSIYPMCIHYYGTFLCLSENLRKPYDLDYFALNYVLKHISCRNRRKLVSITDKYKPCSRFNSFQQSIKKLHIHHRNLINYNNIRIYRIFLIFFKLLLCIVVIVIGNSEKSVYCFCLFACCLGHSFCRTSGRSCKNNLKTHAVKQGYNIVYYRCLSRTRATGYNKDAFLHCLDNSLSLLFRKIYSRSVLKSFNFLVYAFEICLIMVKGKLYYFFSGRYLRIIHLHCIYSINIFYLFPKYFMLNLELLKTVLNRFTVSSEYLLRSCRKIVERHKYIAVSNVHIEYIAYSGFNPVW